MPDWLNDVHCMIACVHLQVQHLLTLAALLYLRYLLLHV